jgi:hypothetical protein
MFLRAAIALGYLSLQPSPFRLSSRTEPTIDPGGHAKAVAFDFVQPLRP